MRKITSIKLYTPAGVQIKDGAEENLLLPLTRYPEIHRVLGREDTLTLELIPGSTWEPLLSSRQKLVCHYDDSSVEEWRIRRVETETSGEGTRVRAVSMWTDLADSVMKRTMAASGETTFGVTIMNQSSEEARQTVLSADWDAPASFAAGNVAAAFAERKPVVEGTAITHLDAIRMICEQLGCEWEARLFEGIYYI